MKKIMVPTDFSEEAENALRVAAQFARKNDSVIYLLHMLDLPLNLVDPSSDSTGSVLPESVYFMKLAHQRFDEIIKKDFLEGIRIRKTVKFHQAFEGIMKISKEEGCDMIVMGSKGVSGFKEFFIGSNTEKVIRYSDIPVLVIKGEIPVFNIKNFVLASDFKEDGKKAFTEAVNFAEKIGAKVHLLYVNTPNRFKPSSDVEELMKNYTESVDYENVTVNIYNDETIEDGIINFRKKIDADLIGVLTHARKGIAHFLQGSISEDIVNHADKPVITFKI